MEVGQTRLHCARPQTAAGGGIRLHIRWGDISVQTLPPEQSTPVDLAAQMIAKMRQCGVQDELSVYLEWHNDTMLSGLGEPYRLVDSGDSIDNLLEGYDGYAIPWDDNGMNHV